MYLFEKKDRLMDFFLHMYKLSLCPFFSDDEAYNCGDYDSKGELNFLAFDLLLFVVVCV